MNGRLHRNAESRTGVSVLDVVVTIVVLLMLAALLLPRVGTSHHEASRRSQCKNNLKQIGMALHNYHDVHRTLPPGITVSDASTKSVGNHFGWATHILPFFDQAPLSKKFNSRRHLTAEPNATQAGTILTAMRCPTDEGPDQASAGSAGGGFKMGTANYVGNFGVGFPSLQMNPKHCQGILGPSTRVRFRDIKDGTSNVVFVGERRNPRECGSFAAIGLTQRSGPGGCTFWAGSSNSPDEQLEITEFRSWEEFLQNPSPSRRGDGAETASTSLFQILGTVRSGAVTDWNANPPIGSIEKNAGCWATNPAPIGINKTVGLRFGRSTEVPMKGELLDKTTVGFSSRHTGGCHVLFGDGTVRFLSEDIDPVTYQNLARRSDGRTLGEF